MPQCLLERESPDDDHNDDDWPMSAMLMTIMAQILDDGSDDSDDNGENDIHFSESSVICWSSPQVFPLPGLQVQLYT